MLSAIPYITANTMFLSAFYTNVNSIKRHRKFQKKNIVRFFVSFSCLAIDYLIWTQIYNVGDLLPLTGYVCFMLSFVLYFLTLWFILPAQTIKNPATMLTILLFMVKIVDKFKTTNFIGSLFVNISFIASLYDCSKSWSLWHDWSYGANHISFYRHSRLLWSKSGSNW